MAADSGDNPKNPVKEAENYTEPASEAVSTQAADAMLRDVFKRAAEDSQPKPGDGQSRLDEHQRGSRDGVPQPGDGRDKFNQHQGEKSSIEAAKGLQKLFNEAGLQIVDKSKPFGNKDGELRFLNLEKSENGQPKKYESGQYVAKDGTTTTRINENTSVEYNPQTQKYTKIDEKGTRTELKDNDKIGPNGETLADLKRDGVAREVDDKNKTTRTTHLDGRVNTKFGEAKPGELEERTTYPPGHPEKLKQSEIYKEKSPGNTAETSRREVSTYEDRKETKFTSADSNISKITAFKNPEAGKPAVVTEYNTGKGPDGARKVETFKDPKPGQIESRTEYEAGKGPDGALKVEKYKDNGKPDGIKQIASFGEGKPEKVTLNNGTVIERQPAGADQTRTRVGETGVLDVNKEGMPTKMQVGDKTYSIDYDKDTGKLKGMTIESPGTPPKKLELVADEKGKLQIKDLEAAKTAGLVSPDGTSLNLDGIPVKLKDGQVQGDLRLNKTGAMQYRDSENPNDPARMEYVRRANGNLETYNFKDWTKTTEVPGSSEKKVQAWDGFNWRDGKQSADGKRFEFAPDPSNPKAPTFIERGSPPDDKTKIGYKDGSVDCDWKKGEQIQRDSKGKEIGRLQYDGATFRKGTEEPINKDWKDPKTGKPAQEGDRLIKFEKGQPQYALKRADGSMMMIHTDGEKTTRIEKNAQGQVTDRFGPEGRTSYGYDADGDLNQMTKYAADGKTPVEIHRRQGAETNPGMQQWLGREAEGLPRQPSDTPPRDPNKPEKYNNWVVSKPKEGGGEELVRTEQKNVYTTADGTTRTENPAQGDKEASLEVNPPSGERYRDTASGRVTEKPGGITETLDKTKNPPVGTLDFNRNGVRQRISSTDGPYTVGQDGTIVQTRSDGTKDTILPSGSRFRSKVEQVPPAKQGEQPTSKETITELSIAKNDKNKPGESVNLAVPPNKSIEPTRAGNFKVTTAEGNVQIYDSKGNIKAESKFKDNKLESVKLGDKEYKVSLNAEGKITGLKPADGEEIKAIPPGAGYVLDDNGSLRSESKDNTDTRTYTEWNPKTNTASVARVWQSADKTQELYYSYQQNAAGEISKFSLPPAGMEIPEQAVKSVFPGFKGTVDEKGNLKLTLDDKQSITVNSDGSMVVNVKNASGNVEQVKIDRNNQIAKDTKEEQKKAALDLLKRLGYQV